jgi:hypothetical protein
MLRFVLFGCLGLAMILWPQKWTAPIDKRMAEGGDRFLDEQRSYAAYPWLRSTKVRRRWGLVLLIGGLAGIVLQLAR